MDSELPDTWVIPGMLFGSGCLERALQNCDKMCFKAALYGEHCMGRDRVLGVKKVSLGWGLCLFGIFPGDFFMQ